MRDERPPRAHSLEIPMRDPDTGAINRALLIEAASPMLSLARRYARTMAFLHIHPLGLESHLAGLPPKLRKGLLREVTDRILGVVRDSDFVARVGPARYVVALTEVWEADAAVRVASRLVRALVELADDENPHDPRVGVAFFPNDADGLEMLLDRARDAADRVSSPSGIAFADPVLGAEALRRAGLERDLLGREPNSQFLLYYQPIFSMQDYEVVGVESLIRWDHALQGLLPAAQFLPLAERTGRVRALDQWSITKALDDSRRWRKHGWDGWVSLNLSARTLGDAGIVDYVEQAMTERTVDPRSIIFEVTENSALSQKGEAAAILEALRGLGSRIAVDDFGTGYASFEYLRDFDPDVVKLDQLFVSGEDNARARRLLNSLVLMVHHLGKPVVVEGLEEESQRDRLLDCGCDMAQGFLLGHPVPAAELEARFLDLDAGSDPSTIES